MYDTIEGRGMSGMNDSNDDKGGSDENNNNSGVNLNVAVENKT